MGLIGTNCRLLPLSPLPLHPSLFLPPFYFFILVCLLKISSFSSSSQSSCCFSFVSLPHCFPLYFLSTFFSCSSAFTTIASFFSSSRSSGTASYRKVKNPNSQSELSSAKTSSTSSSDSTFELAASSVGEERGMEGWADGGRSKKKNEGGARLMHQEMDGGTKERGREGGDERVRK